MISWLVAVLVMLINGYLLMDTISSAVNGVLFTSVVVAFTGAYIAFIVYLISWGVTFSNWFVKNKSISNIDN